MGIAIADYDHDGRINAFVTNDTLPNFLFHNEGKGKFREVGLRAGVALNDDGKPLSSMGVDFRDLDNDSHEDIVMTALSGETFPFFHNMEGRLFADHTYPSRIGQATANLSGWGIGIFDFDNDGWKDIFTANGDVQNNTEQYSGRKSRQQNLLLMNGGKAGFHKELLGMPALHRGVAFGDFDKDGRVDAVVTRLNDTPLLLNNRSAGGNHWIGLKLVGRSSNRDGIGARLVLRSGGSAQTNHLTGSTGYASSSELTVHFGLGNQSAVDRLDIEWPSGKRQRLEGVAADRYLRVDEP